MYVSKIVDNARSFIGVREDPPGSNKVIFNKDYYGREVSGPAYPWCAVFIWDVFRMCDASSLFYDGKKTAYCPEIESWGKKNNIAVPKDKGRAGDIVLYDFYGQNASVHVGIIEAHNKDRSYTTIEGNTSQSSENNGGAVMRRARKQSVIRCIIRPKYQAEPSTTLSNPKTIKEVQQYLNSKISAGLNIDGSFGPLTKKALIKYWQRIVGDLDLDGSFGPKSKAKASANNLDRGDKGELVRILQMALIVKGYSLVGYGADGSFGGETERAVINFQGSSADGIVGSKTWIKLFS